jgi:O-antigen ligase
MVDAPGGSDGERRAPAGGTSQFPQTPSAGPLRGRAASTVSLHFVVVAATGTLSLRERATTALADVSTETLVLAAGLPILFIHVRYQPKFHIALSSTSVGVELSDFVVLAIVIAAIVAGVRRGFAPLRRGAALWIAAALYFAWIAIELAIPQGTAGYPTAKHSVTAAKLVEYAFLAPAVVLILRNRIELRLVLYVVAAWSVLASAVGLVQFFGANIFVSGATGGRQLSFLGFHDFASLSAAALLLGAATFVLPRLELDRRPGWAALVAGCIGVILSAALAAVIGIAIASAALALLALSRRELPVRGIVVAAVAVAIALLGAVAMRGNDLGRYFGLEKDKHPAADVESYAHRTVLAYIGYRIWRDNPIAGVGFEASNDPSRYLRYVPAAKQRYPHEPALAFPTETRRYGVQNFYVQHLADLGVVGLLLLAALYVAALGLALRRLQSTGAVIGLLWTLVVVGLWIAQGIVAGLPLDALTWVSFGLAARG